MVYGAFNYSIHGVYKPTNITGGAHEPLALAEKKPGSPVPSDRSFSSQRPPGSALEWSSPPSAAPVFKCRGDAMPKMEPDAQIWIQMCIYIYYYI